MADESADFLKRGRRRARMRFVFVVVLAAFTLGGVVWRGVSLLQRMSRPDVEQVRAFVSADLTVSWKGRVYGKDQIDEVLAAIAAQHPGAYVLVCAPDVRNPTGAMLTLRSLQHGLKAGLVANADSRCAP